MSESNCYQCDMRRMCRKNDFPEAEERELPLCFRATEQVQKKAQQQLGDEIINWLRCDLDKTFTDTSIKIITFVNAAALLANVIGIVIRFMK